MRTGEGCRQRGVARPDKANTSAYATAGRGTRCWGDCDSTLAEGGSGSAAVPTVPSSPLRRRGCALSGSKAMQIGKPTNVRFGCEPTTRYGTVLAVTTRRQQWATHACGERCAGERGGAYRHLLGSGCGDAGFARQLLKEEDALEVDLQWAQAYAIPGTIQRQCTASRGCESAAGGGRQGRLPDRFGERELVGTERQAGGYVGVGLALLSHHDVGVLAKPNRRCRPAEKEVAVNHNKLRCGGGGQGRRGVDDDWDELVVQWHGYTKRLGRTIYRGVLLDGLAERPGGHPLLHVPKKQRSLAAWYTFFSFF